MFMQMAARRRRMGGAGGEGGYRVTIPSGIVSADLTGFPVPIRLSDMPSSFWAAVRSDGGNVRAYMPDGVTIIPHDLTYINKTRSLGRMFVRRDLLAAANNVIIIKLLDDTETALPVTDTNGRNAVWADYEVVWVFPDAANRTGKAHAQTTTNLLAHSEWIRTDYDALIGTPHNGICTDGTNFVSTDGVSIRRMNMSYALQQTADINTILNPQGIMNINHIGDPVCVGSSMFVTVTDTTVPYRRWLTKLKTSDLTYEGAWEMTGDQKVYGATLCYDGTHLLIFTFDAASKFIKYTTAGSYVGDVALATPTTGVQGSTVLPSGNILISYDPATIKEITPAGADVGVIYTDPHADIMEGLEYRDGNLWLLKGNGVLITLRNDVHQDYRKLHGGNTIYATLPTFSTFSMGVSFYWTTTNFQQGFIGIYNGATGRGARVAYDEGPDRLDAFNSTDSWIVPPVADNPPAYSSRRVALKHDSNVQRKLFIQGNLADTENAISATPAGTGDATFLINGSAIGFEAGECYYQYAWLRSQYMSDAWLEADAKSMSDPANFYTVT